jgi:ribosomal protein S18 acetylase RimI-like enzyme
VENTIRTAEPADAVAIVALLRSVAAESRWIRTEIPFDVKAREEHIRRLIGSGELVGFVSESDSAVVGELQLRFRDGFATFGMVVAARARRQGIGRQLLTRAIAAARDRTVSRIDMEVYAHNVAAIELYRLHGFAESGPRTVEERSDGRRWEVIPMSKDLDAATSL